MQKLIQHNSEGNTAVGLFAGLIGGLGKYLLQVNTTPAYLNIIQAVFTALLCGAAGVAGKEIYQVIKRKIKNRRKP